jgi:predicted transcriptional regulator
LTSSAFFHTLKEMEVHFTPELQAKLESVAAENRRGADVYVQQLVESYVDHDAWFRQKVTASMGNLDRGDSLTHEEVGTRLQKMFQQ